MQAGRPRSVGLACISGSQAFRLVFLLIRRRNACIPGSRASRLHAVVLNRW
ncbi:MAG: hypothetical protein LBP59_15840 [Planctomycetaceae bacterium]|nr:hypothetical protein [Planctomycetaceae bacterium]